MSRIIIHNGNKLVTPLMTNFFRLDIVPTCINNLLDNKSPSELSNYLINQKLCLEITVADSFKIGKILQLNLEKIVISKVVSSYEFDKNNLGPVWLSQTDNWINDYNGIKDSSWPDISTYSDWESLEDSLKKECQDVYGLKPMPILQKNDRESNSFSKLTWLQALFYGSSVCDDLFFLQDLKLEPSKSSPPIIFTPGRCGTHVLMDILDISDSVHHSDTLTSTNFCSLEKLINAEKIYAIVRNTFIDQVCSDAIANQYGVINTVEKNLERNMDQIKKWTEFMIQDHDIQLSLQKFINYSDILLGLSFFYNKKIEFCLLENLQPWFNKIRHKKNHYNHKDIISNYDDLCKKCQEVYQPMCDRIIKKFKQQFGQMLHV